jgi:fructose-1,6-bisphosphatase I
MRETLADHLGQWTNGRPDREPVAATILALAGACMTIARVVGEGPLAGDLAAQTSDDGGSGDAQKELDVRADNAIRAALRHAPVAVFGSEEAETAEVLDPDAPLAVAVDPLDGSSNIDTNVAIGTIFSILPALHGVDADASFLQKGREQLAAGYVLYGPHTAMVLTIGDGTVQFVLDRDAHQFVLTERRMAVPTVAREFAINMSNHRHWDERLRLYVDDLLAGKDGPRDADYNMRWLAAMVAEAHRILIRGGIYLYPGDSRKGYAEGRLRLIYEANPIAFLMEQAGGSATDGTMPILDIMPKRLHQRIPLMFGSREKVSRVSKYLTAPGDIAERAPLFGKRGLLTP